MKILLFLSDAMIPLLIFLIVGYGILNHHHVYDDFIKGAKDGFQTVIGIMPTLIGLMVGVGILRLRVPGSAVRRSWIPHRASAFSCSPCSRLRGKNVFFLCRYRTGY